MNKTLEAAWERCKGCRLCELVCSLSHEGSCNPELSRVRVLRLSHHLAAFPSICLMCTNPACRQACPTGAVELDDATGSVRVNAARCIGCRECVGACPFGAIFISPESGRAIKCDLCDGEPRCVQVCPCGALLYEEPSRLNAEKRRAYAKIVTEREVNQE